MSGQDTISTPRKRPACLSAGLRTRVILYFLLIVVVVTAMTECIDVVGLPLTGYEGYRGQIKQEAFHDLDMLADLKQTRIQYMLEERRDNVRIMAGSFLFRQHLAAVRQAWRKAKADGLEGKELWASVRATEAHQALTELLRQIQAEHEVEHTFEIADLPTGTILVSPHPEALGRVLPQDAFFEHVAQSSCPMIGGVNITPPSQRAVFFLAMAVREPTAPKVDVHDLEPIGLVILKTAMEDLFRTVPLPSSAARSSDETYLVNQDGQLLSPLRDVLRDGQPARLLADSIDSEPASLAARGSSGHMQSLDYAGRAVLAAYRHIPISDETGWGLVVQRQEEDLFAPLAENLVQTLSVELFGLAVAIFLAIWLGRRLTAPMLGLVQTAERVAAGDLEARAPVLADDEIGRLARAFNYMVQKLASARYGLEEKIVARTAEIQAVNADLRSKIQELHEAEHALRLTKFSIDRSAAEVLWTDCEGHLIYVNDSACRMLGYDRSELLQLSVSDINPTFPPERWPSHWREVRERGSFTFETIHRRKDGSTYPVEVQVNYLNFEGQEYNFAFAVDISERRKAEEKRRQLESQLQHAQKLESLGVMAGGIAHDFNNLLTVIRGNADLLAHTLAPQDPNEEPVESIQTAAEQATAMTRALQSFARPTQREIRSLDANQLTRETYRLLRRLLPATIDFTIEPDATPCVLSGDPSQLQQVLVNLCVNARDAMPTGGQLTIQTLKVPAADLPKTVRPPLDGTDFVRIRVQDAGCGMSAETLERIFDPFFSTKSPDMGTGLGLAIVYRIVESHHGGIDVVSEPERGTRFDLFFPLLETNGEIGLETEPLREPKPEKIVVVEHEELIAGLLKTVLESYGYTTTMFSRSQDALALTDELETTVDLVILEEDLPKTSWQEILERLRRYRPSLKAIILGNHTPAIEEARSETTWVIHKPFTAQTLAQTVEKMLHPPSTKGQESAQ